MLGKCASVVSFGVHKSVIREDLLAVRDISYRGLVMLARMFLSLPFRGGW